MSAKKFSLSGTPVKRLIHGKEYLLYRIIAEKSFETLHGHVKKGDLGGLVSSEKNLSQEGNCWIFHGASVVENAVVKNDAVIACSAKMKDNAVIKDSAFITDDAIIAGNSVVANSSTIDGYAVVSGDAQVTGDSLITNDAIITGRSVVSNLKVKDNTVIKIPCSIDCIEAPPEAPITISGASLIRHTGQPLNNVFNEEPYSFKLKDAILNKPEDCCIIPLYFCNEQEFFVKYKSLSGTMIYNSMNEKTSTIEEFQKEALELFEVYRANEPVNAEAINPFVEWLRDYNPKNNSIFADLADKLVEQVKISNPKLFEKGKPSSIPMVCISNYLELHLLSLPWLLGIVPFSGISQSSIVALIEKIIERSSLDIRLNKLVDFGDAIFLNARLLRAIFSPCCESGKLPETTTVKFGKSAILLIA